ncbi:hypothetical protein ACFL5O_03410 [Myxococcota bacterium]
MSLPKDWQLIDAADRHGWLREHSDEALDELWCTADRKEEDKTYDSCCGR